MRWIQRKTISWQVSSMSWPILFDFGYYDDMKDVNKCSKCLVAFLEQKHEYMFQNCASKLNACK